MPSQPKAPKDLLFYADSERTADLFYLGRMFVPDAFLAGRIRGRSFAMLSMLEMDRARTESCFDEVLPLEAWREEAKQAFGLDRVSVTDLVRLLMKRRRVRAWAVPYDFPAGLSAALGRAGVRVVPAETGLFPERVLKTPEELLCIRQANRASAAGLRAAETALRRAVVKGNKLWLDGRVLTAEALRTRVDAACLECGALPAHTIVAGGVQACDPHGRGSGVLRPHELMIVDVFPRDQKTGYFGDMTRTFLKGRANEAQRALVAAVRGAQRAAWRTLRAGVSGEAVHAAAQAYFAAKGYVTERRGGRHQGFIHGTGHGLGLEVHEAPRLSMGGPVLRAGMVVTVEPGLYYTEIGGCRIEDVAGVTDGGAEALSRYAYQWEIP